MSVAYSMKPAGFPEAVGLLRDASSQIADQLDLLDEATRTLRGQWTGAAQKAYDRAQADWDEVIRRMNAILDESAGVPDRALAIHYAARTRVAALWR